MSSPIKSDGTLSGRSPNMLATDIAKAMQSAGRRGMDLDQALCVLVQVAADYARGEYGPEYVEALGKVMRDRCQMPMPSHEGDGA